MNDKLLTFLFSYRHDGAEWAFEVQAESMEDAKARVSKMAYTTYDGELVCKIPAPLGLLPRTMAAMRNSLSRIFATSSA